VIKTPFLKDVNGQFRAMELFTTEVYDLVGLVPKTGLFVCKSHLNYDFFNCFVENIVLCAEAIRVVDTICAAGAVFIKM
jgi:hypothetical protein